MPLLNQGSRPTSAGVLKVEGSWGLFSWSVPARQSSGPASCGGHFRDAPTPSESAFCVQPGACHLSHPQHGRTCHTGQRCGPSPWSRPVPLSLPPPALTGRGQHITPPAWGLSTNLQHRGQPVLWRMSLGTAQAPLWRAPTSWLPCRLGSLATSPTLKMSPEAVAESWMGSGAAETRTGAHMGCRRCRRRINLLRHGAGPSMKGFKPGPDPISLVTQKSRVLTSGCHPGETTHSWCAGPRTFCGPRNCCRHGGSSPFMSNPQLNVDQQPTHLPEEVGAQPQRHGLPAPPGRRALLGVDTAPCQPA
nr:uncharacterized protein LOC127485320 [Oryctolagus cuniculus]